MPKFDPETMTIAEWQDALGQTFEPGDIIAVSTISGRSPQTVIAQVERINTHDSKGNQHLKKVYSHTTEEPNLNYAAQMENVRAKEAKGLSVPSYAMPKATWKKQHYDEVQDVTVTAKPLVDGRGFHRSKTKGTYANGEWKWEPLEGGARAVTYTILGNIVKLGPDAVLALHAKMHEDGDD